MFRWPRAVTVVRREYLARVRTKAFWLSTLLVPLLLALFTLGPSFLMARGGGQHRIAVVGGKNDFFLRFAEQVQQLQQQEALQGAVHITLEPLPLEDLQRQREELKRSILEKRYTAALFVPQELSGQVRIEFLSTNVTAFRLIATLDRAAERAVRELRLEQAGLRSQAVKELLQPVDFVPVRIEKGGKETKEAALPVFFLGYGLMFLLWFTVMMYGMQIMRGVLEEKSSRIVEVIVANLSPMELMFGKILGVGAVGLTQFFLWLLLATNVAALAGPAVANSAALELLSKPSLWLFFGLFFVLGYFLYGTLYAALGAAFNSEEEAQQMQAVAGWVMALPFLFMLPVMNNPDSIFSVVVSLVPFFSPSLYFLRLVVHTPPWWQTAFCLGLLLLTTVGLARLAAAIYRVGILTYGKRPTLRELVRWAREG